MAVLHAYADLYSKQVFHCTNDYAILLCICIVICRVFGLVCRLMMSAAEILSKK